MDVLEKVLDEADEIQLFVDAAIKEKQDTNEIYTNACMKHKEFCMYYNNVIIYMINGEYKRHVFRRFLVWLSKQNKSGIDNMQMLKLLCRYCVFVDQDMDKNYKSKPRKYWNNLHDKYYNEIVKAQEQIKDDIANLQQKVESHDGDDESKREFLMKQIKKL